MWQVLGSWLWEGPIRKWWPALRGVEAVGYWRWRQSPGDDTSCGELWASCGPKEFQERRRWGSGGSTTTELEFKTRISWFWNFYLCYFVFYFVKAVKLNRLWKSLFAYNCAAGLKNADFYIYLGSGSCSTHLQKWLLTMYKHQFSSYTSSHASSSQY